MLDIMGNFALGVELGNLKPGSGATNTTFDKCYHEVFEPKGLGQILVALNGIFPVRWLPLEANRRFVQANKIVRSQLTEIMQDRIRTVGERKTAGMDGMPAGEVQDVLTYLVAEKYYSNDDRWTEEQILNQVCISMLLSVAVEQWANPMAFRRFLRSWQLVRLQATVHFTGCRRGSHPKPILSRLL